MPRIFILKNPVDTGSTPPEDDPANWRELPLGRLSYGDPFHAAADVNPGTAVEWALTTAAEDRTGYGWAVGGVKGNGEAGYISITELRAYGMELGNGQQTTEGY